MKASIKPIYDRVLVKPLEKKEDPKSRIIIPDTAKEQPLEGEVVDIGTSPDFVVKKGDKVIFEKGTGALIKSGNDKYLIIREEDILGIIK